ncbi:MAG: ABC transporter substrate-binding protein [Tissierellaceae bacterium]|jgi:putative ABC transport system substrate-binding protein|nr:ABC transporter substrate-binding protein [Tissierellia bacterium]
MKKFSKVVLLVLAVVMMLTGCNSGQKVIAEDENVFDIGIIQLAEHPALDDARKGFEDGLKELGVDVNISYQNAQGEIPATLTMAEKFVDDGVDLIYAIATSAAQSAKQATSEIPILFSAVTDPVDAELVDSMEKPGGNVTGTSDMSPMDRQLQLFKDLKPDIEKIGIIYNTSEPNSLIQVNQAKELAEGLGLEIIDVGINTINDIALAMDSLVGKVDGIYTITDNMVASSIGLVANKAIENGIITIAGEDSHVHGGILMTDGISYYELGKQTAKMAKEILVDGKSPAEIPSERALNTSKVYNEETLNLLNLDKNNEAFKGATKIEP